MNSRAQVSSPRQGSSSGREHRPNHVAEQCEYLTFQRTAGSPAQTEGGRSLAPAAAALVSAALALPAFAAPASAPETLPGTASVITLSGKRAKLVVATPLSPAAY